MVINWKRFGSFEPTAAVLKGTFLVTIGFIRFENLPAKLLGMLELKSFIP
jgi:hypothetical protein